MKDIRILLCILLFLGACAELPKIRPLASPDTQALQAGCCAAFPSGKWRFVHSIEVKLPGGRQGFFLGVTVVSEKAETMECVIMSMEGFVFFDAGMDRNLTIHRAVPPFDNKEFAWGLIRDIQLLFFCPKDRPREIGRLEKGFPVCRYRMTDGGVEDVITHPDHSWEIRRYGKNRRLIRTVRAMRMKKLGSPAPSLIPETLDLKAYGHHSYELAMKLVEAEHQSQR